MENGRRAKVDDVLLKNLGFGASMIAIAYVNDNDSELHYRLV
jgi:hypothetical protein